MTTQVHEDNIRRPKRTSLKDPINRPVALMSSLATLLMSLIELVFNRSHQSLLRCTPRLTRANRPNIAMRPSKS